MRFLLAFIIGILAVPVSAYYESTPFYQSRFRNEIGMFRYIDGCWFRLTPSNIYDTEEPIVCGTYDDLMRTLEEEERQRSSSSSSSSRSVRSSSSRSRFFSWEEFREKYGYGTGGQTSSSRSSLSFSGNSFLGSSGRRMHDFFYRPLGLGCDSIHDSKDGGALGPIPCTWYPGVFGPVPEY